MRAGRSGEHARTTATLGSREHVRRYVNRVDNLARPDGLAATAPRASLEPWTGLTAGTATGVLTGLTGVFVIPAVPYLNALGLAAPP